MKTCINPKLYRLFLEKMVIGLEEPVLVKGIGELVAKVDSGNSGYNVIHGDDIIMQGDIVTFKTFNKDGDERRVSKKLKDTIKINIGGGHIQDRPVVELDVQFGGQDYKKIPFSITDRGDNEHKVLISKDFVGNELDALIDVTKDNIANDNIEVDYVTEGLMSGLKKAAGAVGNVTNAAIHGTEGMQKMVNKAEGFKKAMWGEGGTPGINSDPNSDSSTDKSSKVSQANTANDESVKNIGNLKKIQKDDAALIRTYIAKAPINEIVQDKLDCPTDEEYIAVYKLLDFTGGTCGSENADPEFKKKIEVALKKYKNLKKGSNVVVGKATDPEQNAKKVDKNNDDIASTKQNLNPNEMTEDEIEVILNELKERNYSIFYIIGFTKDANGRNLAKGEDIISNSKNKVENWGAKISQNENWDYSAFIPFANDIGASIENEGINAKGFFALVSGKPGARKAEFYSSGTALFGANAEGVMTIDDKIVQEYVNLNDKFKILGDGLLGPNDTISLENINTLIDYCEENMNNIGENN